MPGPGSEPPCRPPPFLLASSPLRARGIYPAVIAQAAATLGEMFPGRFRVAVWSGELVNEGITGDRWPLKVERNERLCESAEIMRNLWSGKTVTYRGHVKADKARLYTLPSKPPLLAGAAISAKTAEWMGGWADTD